VQLTNFRRIDTWVRFSRERLFFLSSADPLGTNPGDQCQLFSMNALGEGLRQLTRLHERGRASARCGFFPVRGDACTVNDGGESLVSRGAWFVTSCDPLGTNRYGQQLFSMRSDGTGLRQLTAFRGREIDTDGTVRVELPQVYVQGPRGQDPLTEVRGTPE
jgi:hypothetical protein